MQYISFAITLFLCVSANANKDLFNKKTSDCVIEQVMKATPFLKNSNLQLGSPYLINSDQEWEILVLNKFENGESDHFFIVANGNLSEALILFPELTQHYPVDLSSCF